METLLVSQAQLDTAKQIWESGQVDAKVLFGSDEEQGSRTVALSVEDGIATIPVSGFLSNTPNPISRLFLALFGGVHYADLRAAIDEAETRLDVNEIHFLFNTSGGDVPGLAQTAELIRASSKPTLAVVERAASGGYWLAAAADRIEAVSQMGEVGSVGAAMSVGISPDKRSLTFISAVSPLKRADANTAEGQQYFQSYVDQIGQMFVKTMAEYRGVSIGQVSEAFGKGGMLLAAKALEVGMIDGIRTRKRKVNYMAQKPSNAAEETSPVVLGEADIVTARQEGETAGRQAERTRFIEVLKQPTAKGNLTTALTLLATDLNTENILNVLATMPTPVLGTAVPVAAADPAAVAFVQKPAVTPFDQAMAGVGNPNVAPGTGETNVLDEATAAAQAAADNHTKWLKRKEGKK